MLRSYASGITLPSDNSLITQPHPKNAKITSVDEENPSIRGNVKSAGEAVIGGASSAAGIVYARLKKANKGGLSAKGLRTRAWKAATMQGTGAAHPAAYGKHLAQLAGEGAIDAASAARKKAKKVTKHAFETAMDNVKRGAHLVAHHAAQQKEKGTEAIERTKSAARKTAKEAAKKAARKAAEKLGVKHKGHDHTESKHKGHDHTESKHKGHDHTESKQHGTVTPMPTQDLRNIFDNLCVTVEFT